MRFARWWKWELVDRYSAGEFVGWVEKGDRFAIACGLYGVKTYGPDSDFCGVQLKGTACEHVGHEGLARFLRSLSRFDRWQATRIDYAWDDVPWSVDDMVGWVEGGCTRSRCKIPDQPWVQRFEGFSTVYVGKGPGQSKPVYACCYDKHGFTRYEVRWSQDKAVAVVSRRLLVEPGQGASMVQRYVGWDQIDKLERRRVELCLPVPLVEVLDEVAKRSDVSRNVLCTGFLTYVADAHRRRALTVEVVSSVYGSRIRARAEPRYISRSLK